MVGKAVNPIQFSVAGLHQLRNLGINIFAKAGSNAAGRRQDAGHRNQPYSYALGKQQFFKPQRLGYRMKRGNIVIFQIIVLLY